MICSDCGGENRKNARFCSWCGVRLALRCAVCATDIVAGAEFCDACGTPVGEPATTPAPLGARKVVTVLFADLAGSTSQAERMDPESVRGFMDAYYAVVREAVEGEDGRVVKLMGDGVMAAFGVPRVAEDDAVRALRAAHAIQVGFAGLADRALQQFGTPVALRVGVNTGEVVVATGDNDVVGDAVNVAARLESAAGPGEVIAGESTWRLVRDVMDLEALPPLVVKGKAEPVRAYRLVSLEPPESASPPGTTTFVGRDAELARLVGFFDEAIAAGATRLVSVIGSPGVGKSRLSRELVATLAPRARVLEANCPPAGGATFGPVADILRDADLEANEDLERAITLLNAPQATPEELFWAIRRALASAATAEPLVVVLDDIHWAEPMLLDLIEHLAEWGRDAPILLVTLARPELRDLRPSLAEGGRRVAGVVVLEGLGGEASQRLARDLLGAGDLPAAIAGKVLAVTEGNPLFLRELVRMLVEDGVLVRDGDQWIASVNAAELEIPPTVHALLSARLERLDADERIILERAAVIGPQFPRGGVAALAPPTVVEDLDRHLEALRRRELVEPEGTYSGDEPLFRFHHVLIRDAAYRGLLREARADLHERYADWLEAKLGEAAADQAEVLGFHLERAHAERQQLGGEARIELGLRAARWLALAGRRALERDDVGAAAGLLGRALDRAPDDDEDRPSLLIERAEAVLAAGDVTTGSACVDVLNTLAKGSDRLSAWAECFAGQLANLVDPSRLHTTVDEVSAAAERLAAVDDFAGAAKAHGVRAQALARLGRIAECEAALDKALAAARQAGDLRRANSVLAGAPLAALWGPSPVARASGKCLDVVRVLRITSGSPAVEATALRCQAVLEALRGRDDAARRMLAAARTSLEELGLRSGLLETDLFSGLIELLAGDAVAAEAHLRAAYDGFRELGVDVDAAQSAALLARALLAQNRDDEALQLTEESERRGGEDLKTAIAWRSARAEALARRGDIAEALRLARQAVTLAQPTDLIIDHADACSVLATVLRLAGRPHDAAEEARVAAELYERKGATAAAERIHAPTALAPAPEPGDGRPAIPPNAAVEASTRMASLIAARQWEDLEDLLAGDVVYEERRSGLRTGAVGKTQWLRDLRFVHSVAINLEQEILATRGSRLRLARLRWSGDAPASGPFEGEHLDVAEVDAAGRLITTIAFDAEDLHAAVAELDRRYIEGEGRPHAAEVAVALRLIQLYNERDFEQMRPLFAPEFVLRDLRPAGWGTLDTEAYFRVMQGLIDLAPDVRLVAETIEVRDGRVVYRGRAQGRDHDGGSIELSYVNEAVVTDNGRVLSFEFRPIDSEQSHLPAAPALPVRRIVPPNRASRALERLLELAGAGRWPELDEIVAADFTTEDRTFGAFTRGRAEFLADLRYVFSIRISKSVEVVATRGELLALVRISWSGVHPNSGAFHVEKLALDVADPDGRMRANVLFDPGEDEAAIAELDRRYLAGEGAPYAGEIATLQEWLRLYNDREWDRYGAVWTPGFRVVDHRTAGWGEIDGPGYLEALRGMVDLAPDVRARLLVMDAAPARVVSLVGVEGTSVTGGHIEIDLVMVAAFEHGRLTQLDIHEPASLPSLRGGIVSPQEQPSRPIATRGDRVALYLAGPSDGGDSEHFQVVETGDADQVVARVRFDVGALDAAFAELDERYVALEPGFAPVSAFFRCFNRRQWDNLAETLHADCTFVDSPGGAGVLERDSYLEYLKAATDLAPGARLRVLTVPATGPSGCVVQASMSGEGLAGGAMDGSAYAVLMVRSGKLVRVERMPGERLDAALRRFAELSTRTPPVENQAVRVLALYESAVRAGDWEGVTRLLADDVTLTDQRTASQTVSSGADAVRRELRFIKSAIDDIRSDVRAIRGERLSLVQRTAAGTDQYGNDFEVSFLQVIELHDDGRVIAMTNFDPDDMEAAVALLDERYLAGEGLPFRNPLAVGFAFIKAFNARDWDAVAAIQTDDFVQHDHIPVASGTTDKAGWLRMQQHTAEVAPDTRFDLVALYRHETSTSLGLYRRTGTQMGSGEIDTSVILITRWRDNQMAAVERFAVEQFDLASRRFDQLAAERGDRSLIENRVSRLVEAAPEALRTAVAPNATSDDLRTGLRNRALIHDSLDSLGAFGFDRVQRQVVATRGDRLAMFRVTWTRPAGPDAGDAEIEYVAILEADETGAITGAAAYDIDDIDAAYDALDERYMRTLPPAHAARVRDSVLESRRRFNRRAWDDMARVETEDFVAVDHAAGFGTVDRDGLAAMWRSTAELAPDIRLDFPAVVRVAPYAILSLSLTTSSGLGGAPTELPMLNLTVYRHGRTARLERFRPEELEAAIQRFEEVTSAAAAPDLVANAVTRAYEAIAGPDWIDRQFEYFVEVHSPDVVVEARSAAGERYRTEGRDACMAEARSLYDVGLREITVEPLAVRGERLALIRFVNSGVRADLGGGHSVVEQVAVCEANEHGLIDSIVIFEPADLRHAIIELNARYGAQAGDDAPPRPYREWGIAMAGVDAEAVRPVLSDDFVMEDHRLLGGGTVGPDEFVDALRAFGDAAVGTVGFAQRVLRETSHGTVELSLACGPGLGGGGFEMSQIAIMRYDESKITRFELFALEHLDEALARFDELEGVESEPALQNSASRILDPFDLQRFMSAPAVDNMVVHDRRKVAQASIFGADDANAHAEAFPTSRAEVTTLAVRGDRLSLQRVLFVGEADHGGGEIETEVLLIHELNADGLLASAIGFDVDDEDAAYRELDDRYVADEAGASAETYRHFARGIDQINRRDWDGWRARIAEEFIYVDHRPLGFDTRTRDEFVDTQREFVGLSDDLRWRVVRVLRLEPGVVLVQVDTTGSVLSGGVAETQRLMIGTFDHRGICTRCEGFDVSDLDAAVARFGELASFTGRFGATRFADDVVAYDRRSGLAHTMLGRRGLLASIRSLPLPIVGLTPIATRGERLSLYRVDRAGDAPHGGGDAEVSFLVVHERNAAGEVITAVLFDVADLSEAVHELDRLYLAGEGAANAVVDWLSQLFAVSNAHDWTAAAALLSPEFEFVDRGPYRVGAHDRDGYMALQRAFMERPETVTFMASIVEVRGDAALYISATTAVGLAGDDATVTTYPTIIVVRDGLGLRMESFGEDDLDAARARFDELTPSTAPFAGNAAVAHFLAEHGGLAAHISPNVVLHDHRAGLRLHTQGIDAVRRSAHVAKDFGLQFVSREPVAVRGDRIALMAVKHSAEEASGWGGGPVDTDYLVLAEVDESGLVGRIDVFDRDDLEAATAELDRRYAGVPTPAQRQATLAAEAMNEQRWDDFIALNAEHVEFVDRRAGLTSALVGRDAMAEMARYVFSLNARMTPEVLATRGSRLVLCREWMTGTDQFGSPFEVVVLNVTEVDEEGRATAHVLFEDSDLDEAMAELDRRFERVDGDRYD